MVSIFNVKKHVNAGIHDIGHRTESEGIMKLIAITAAATLGLGSVAMADDTMATPPSTPPAMDATPVQNVQTTNILTDDSPINQDFFQKNNNWHRHNPDR